MEHYPVQRTEVLEYLAIRPESMVGDATAGLGGHTGAIAERLTSGHVYAADADTESMEVARRNTAQWADRITFLHSRFSELRSKLSSLGVGKLNGLVADLGVSRYQLTDAERGFSIQNDGPLDCRMDRTQGESAADLVNFTDERALADLIYRLGEERRGRRIARAIVQARPVRSTAHLARIVEQVVPRTGRLHPATQTFMALRQAVNHEQEELDALLESIPELVETGGRVAVISFMSLEDRKVKRAFQALARAGKADLLTRHVVRPSEEEIDRNPASRSAKLRALELK